MKNKLILFVIAILIFSSVQILAMSQAPKTLSLAGLKNDVSAELNSMDSDLAEAAKQIAKTGLNSDATAKLLKKIYKDHPSIVDLATVNPSGRLILVKPDKYKSAEGNLISSQPHFEVLKETKKPVLSNLFMTVEGFNAVSLAYPVMSTDGQLIGFVSIVFQPFDLIRNILKSYAPSSSTEIMTLQLDGRILYDKDLLQVGKMTFSDPMYRPFPALLELAKKIVGEPGGKGIYEFPAIEGSVPIQKDTQWTTISLHGTQWRLIVSTTK